MQRRHREGQGVLWVLGGGIKASGPIVGRPVCVIVVVPYSLHSTVVSACAINYWSSGGVGCLGDLVP